VPTLRATAEMVSVPGLSDPRSLKNTFRAPNGGSATRRLDESDRSPEGSVSDTETVSGVLRADDR
jgi:hypothetical protein